jgi:hypothetical protein
MNARITIIEDRMKTARAASIKTIISDTPMKSCDGWRRRGGVASSPP